METALTTEPDVKNALAAILSTSTFNPNMRAYLGFRACGFSVREACRLAGIGESTVRRWRLEDATFAYYDSPAGYKELTEQFSYRYLELEFLKNYCLVLKKDFDVLAKSIQAPQELTKHEEQYLIKLRSHYTPEQMAVIKRMVEAGEHGEVSFTQLILQLGSEQLKLTAGEAKR